MRLTMSRSAVALVVAFALPTAPGVAAQQAASPAEAEAASPKRDSPFGIGFQSSWPAWGISGIYDVSPRITAQAVVGAMGTLSTIGGRGLYRLTREESHSFFGYGTAGMWRAKTLTPVVDGSGFRTVNRTESVLGVGGGAGVELNWQRILSPEDRSFPPLFGTIEIGLVLADFDHYNFSGFTLGSGLHYRF
jgi:hypothetical protein